MRLLPSHRVSGRRRRGQAMVEFALVLPILALLLVMAIDFGRVFFGWVALQNAARIAADTAAGTADAWPSDNPSEDILQAEYQAKVARDLEAINCQFTPPVPDPEFPDGKDPGDPAIVTLECSFGLITPLASSIIGGTVDLTSQATFPIHKQLNQALPSPPVIVTPTPSPAGSPSPTNCTVPPTVSGSRNDARNLWAARGFTPANLIEDGNGNFTVQSQSQLAGASIPCSSSMTISAGASLTPAPTPSPTPIPPPPTPTPVPTPTPIPTPTPVPCVVPVASFTFAPASPTRQTNVQFTDTSTAQAHCPITGWSWNFGDGSATSPAQNPTHRYNYGGNAQSQQFTVILTVTNVAGSATSSQVITVTR